MKLYEIPRALREALEAMSVDEETGEITSDVDLDAIEGEAAVKIENSGLFVRELLAEVDALKVEEERLAARRRSLSAKAEHIKQMMMPALESMGGKVKGTRLTVYFGSSKSVVVDDVKALPSIFTKIKVEANKTEIKSALVSGEKVPGARIVESRSIRMR